MALCYGLRVQVYVLLDYNLLILNHVEREAQGGSETPLLSYGEIRLEQPRDASSWRICVRWERLSVTLRDICTAFPLA